MKRPAVASGHPETTRAAVEVLQAGGNAVDAAIAAAFASAVSEPALTSLAGGGFLIDCPVQGEPEVWDFFVDVPGRGRPTLGDASPLEHVLVDFRGSKQRFGIGAASIAVPGCLFGYLEAHAARGRVPLSVVVAPAVQLARRGVVLNQTHAFILGILTPIFTATPDARALFAPAGRMPALGETLRNPDLADFLEALPEGIADDLRHGALARAAVDAVQAGGGLLTTSDLEGYQVIRREPLRVRFHGTELFLNPAPSWGGGLLALSLSILERCGRPHPPLQLVEVLREVDRQRQADENDARLGAQRVLRVSNGTTHVSVVDAAGDIAAITTSNGSGCGQLIPGTGILWNNMLGEDDLLPTGVDGLTAGQRVRSMMCPGLARRPDGTAFAFGSGGSKRIRTALLQVLAAVLGEDQSLAAAIEAPRLHWDGQVLQLEPGFSADIVDALRARVPLNVWDSLNIYFGGVQAVGSDGQAAADPRREGSAWVGS